MPEESETTLVAVRLQFAEGDGIIIFEKGDDYSLANVERFCWLNAQALFAPLGAFLFVTEIQDWPSRAELSAWLQQPGNDEELIGHHGDLEIGPVGPLRLDGQAPAG
jgi:hypothetical protein